MAEVAKLVESIKGLSTQERAELGLEVIKSLTMVEISNWVKMMEEEFGVSAAAPVAVAAGPVAGGVAEVAAEPTEFNVVLISSGDKKIQVIKEVRAITNLGLKEAKDLVDSPPKTVKEGVSKEEGEKIKKQLEDAGAKVELKG